MEFLLLLLGIALVIVLAVWLFILKQGDAEFKFMVDQRTEFKVDAITPGSVTMSCKVPFINKGTQDGTIMDAYPRHLLPKEQFDAVEVISRLTIESQPRDDGYWEAIIFHRGKGDTAIITVKFTAKQGDIRQALTDMVDMPVEIIYQVVARSNWYITKARLVLTAEEIKRALNSVQADRGE